MTSFLDEIKSKIDRWESLDYISTYYGIPKKDLEKTFNFYINKKNAK